MTAPSEEVYGKSTEGAYCWKGHSVGYNAIADNTGLYPHSFIRCCL